MSRDGFLTKLANQNFYQRGSVNCNGSSLGCLIDGSLLLHRRTKDSQGKGKSFSFIVNIKDILDYPVMREKFPVKCLPSSQKFFKSSVLCDLILLEISLHCGIVVL